MSTEAALAQPPLSPFEQIQYARQVILCEAQALSAIARRLDTEFCRAVEQIFRCDGSVVVTGIGKAGIIGQKVSATLASTGTPSTFLHPGEAVHGDLGRLRDGDMVLVLSQSGETAEVLRLLPSFAAAHVPLIAITGSRNSSLARAALVTLELGLIREACALGLAPSTSTTAMLGVGDALALVASRMRAFGRDDFARLHPAGNLGRKLAKVEDHMRPLAACRVAECSHSVRQVFVAARWPGRRTGAIMVVDPDGALRGVFTDSDLARLFESRRDGALDGPIRDVMTRNPTTILRGALLTDAVEIMAERKISELPVVEPSGNPAGLIDITDVVGLFPERALALANPPAASSVPASPAVSDKHAPPRPKHLLFREPRRAVEPGRREP